MMAWLSRLIMVVVLWSVPLGAMGQTPAPEQRLLKTEELDQLLAALALYPDPLLSQALIASTYPLEVVQAERWATMMAFNPDITWKVTDAGRPRLDAISLDPNRVDAVAANFFEQASVR
jgi:Protein of unknown function (DUF3300)